MSLDARYTSRGGELVLEMGVDSILEALAMVGTCERVFGNDVLLPIATSALYFHCGALEGQVDKQAVGRRRGRARRDKREDGCGRFVPPAPAAASRHSHIVRVVDDLIVGHAVGRSRQSTDR